MTQGKATTSRSGATKVEPISRAVPPAYPARIGLAQGNHVMDKGTVNVTKVPMYEGRGLEAPTVKCTPHKGGSQGKY